MNQAVSANRLLALAAFLEKLPRKRFDYSSWVGEDWKGAQDLSCGTTACALGWAATLPKFRRLGLRLYDINGKGEVRLDGDRRSRDIFSVHPSLHAAMRVFGLTKAEATYVFTDDYQAPDDIFRYSPLSDATPAAVAAHIRRFVKQYRAPGKR